MMGREPTAARRQRALVERNRQTGRHASIEGQLLEREGHVVRDRLKMATHFDAESVFRAYAAGGAPDVGRPQDFAPRAVLIGGSSVEGRGVPDAGAGQGRLNMRQVHAVMSQVTNRMTLSLTERKNAIASSRECTAIENDSATNGCVCRLSLEPEARLAHAGDAIAARRIHLRAVHAGDLLALSADRVIHLHQEIRMMISSRHKHRVVVLLALSLTAVASTAIAGHGVERIAKARDEALGTTVTVRGTVTVPTGAFDPGFAIQDGHAGIYVLDSGSAARVLGAEVEVTGVLVDSFGLLAIQPSAITALGSAKQVKPHKLATGSVGESTEGRLLALEGSMVGDLVDDSPFGFKLDIDDGSGPIQIFLFPGTGISTAGLVNGVMIEVVCFSNQFDTIFECDPRNPADLEIDD